MNYEDILIEKAKETPYQHLDGYMERYWLTPFDPDAKTNIRIHHILSSDDDRAFHDHPWPSTSIILKGGYWEYLPLYQHQHPSRDFEDSIAVWRATGDVITRKAGDRHRLELNEGDTCWSMFIMGQYEQKWGFFTDEGKIYWRDYLGDYETQTSSDVIENS